jgi:hypothetical protein
MAGAKVRILLVLRDDVFDHRKWERSERAIVSHERKEPTLRLQVGIARIRGPIHSITGSNPD